MKEVRGISRRQALALAALGVPWTSRIATAATKPCAPSPAPPTKPAIAVSLRALQDDLAVCGSAASCENPAFSLYGLTQIGGFVIDSENQDIVLLGAAASNAPPLFVDDFAVALRSLLLRYAKLEGNTRIFSFPGISIDPMPETIRRLMAALRDFNADRSAGSLAAAVERFRAICESPQHVRIIGIPASRFAMTMLEADYKLKRIADGTLQPLSELKGLLNRELDSAIAEAQRGNPLPGAAYNRFWFVAGDCVQSSGQTTTTLDQCDVALLTEQELATKEGNMVGAGGRDVMATRFACDVSSIFPNLAAADATYRKLDALYRWMSLARVIIDNNAVEKSRLDISLLTDTLQIDHAHVPKTVPGRFALGSAEIRNGNLIGKLRLPSCGGVEMAFPKGKVTRGRKDPARLDEWGKKTLAARPRNSKLAASWPVRL
jgi:hypothetical protein